MFKKIGLATTFIGVLLTTSTAHAIPIVDTVDQNAYVGWGETYSYTHNLLDDSAFTLGTAISGTIKIQIYDDKRDGWFKSEGILIVVDDFDFDTGGIMLSASTFANNVEVNALAKINSSGMLDISISSLWGDFYVGQSILTIETADVSVPEPGILGLLSLGLLGFGVTYRLRKS